MRVKQITSARAVLYATSANVIFGINLPFMQDLLVNEMTPFMMSFLRVGFAAIAFWILSVFLPREKVERKDLLILAIGGFSGFIISQVFTGYGLNYTGTVNAALIVCCGPAIVACLSAFFLSERFKPKGWAGIALTIAGISILIAGGPGVCINANDLIGMGYVFLGSVFYSAYIIISRKISLKYQLATQLKWLFLFTLLEVLPFMFFQPLDQPILTEPMSPATAGEVFFCLFFATFVGYFLIPVALKSLPAAMVGAFMNIQPIVATVVAILMGMAVLELNDVIAGSFVLLGVNLVVHSNRSVRTRGHRLELTKK